MFGGQEGRMGGDFLTVHRSASLSIILPSLRIHTSFIQNRDVQSYQLTESLNKTILFFLATNVFHDEHKRVL